MALAGNGDIMVVTTPNLEGTRIVRYLGIVSGEAIMGANIFKDFFAGIRDIIGGRSGMYEQELRKAKTVALDEMVQQARELGANAIVAVDLDYESIGTDRGGMLMVTAAGTAIVYER